VPGYRILLGSDRDGSLRGYSVRPDGSGLTALTQKRDLMPVTLSRDGKTVAYQDGAGGIFVSRADGSHLRRVARQGASEPALSPNGRLLAFVKTGRIWIVGTNGRALRQLTSGRNDRDPDWSPNGATLAFVSFSSRGSGLFIQSLRGRRRLLVRGDSSYPRWSPDGRSIAYPHFGSGSRAKNGIYVVRRDGRRSRLVVRGASVFAWSPDGRRLAFRDGSPALGIVGVDGRGLKRLTLPVVPSYRGDSTGALAWSPDARLVFTGHTGDDAEQIWIVGVDGHGLQRVTGAGTNSLVGWTRLTPRGRPAPPLPPGEHVLGADTVVTSAPVAALSADASRVAFITGATRTDCTHVAVWAPAARTLARFSPSVPAPCREGGLGGMYGVVLAGSRMAWAAILGCGNSCDVALASATLTAPVAAHLTEDYGAFDTGGPPFDYHVHGDGDLLVFKGWNPSRLVRIGAGTEACGDGQAHICTTLRRLDQAALADSASDGLIAIREPDQVTVVDDHGALVREFPFLPDEVKAAKLDGHHLVVTRLALLEVYDVSSGALELSVPLPTGYALQEVDGGVAVLRRSETFMLLRLADGRSRTIAPGSGPRFAALEPEGLYQSYVVGKEGRVVFVPHSNLF
jgi:Tol biopolymer transport system component